jgi:hypothetical protein
VEHISKAAARDFVITPYEEVGGRLEPCLPTVGPCQEADDRPCRLGVHQSRSRKTGPLHDLVVVHCHTHGRFFTLYPPGYAPYKRKPVGLVAPDGRPVLHQVDPRAGEGELLPRLERFAGTLFEAGLDASMGRTWSRFGPWGLGGAERYWSTQCRQIEVAARLLGVSGQLRAPDREAITEVLGTERMLVSELSAEVRRRPGYRAHGAAIAQVLATLPAGRCEVDRLLDAGHVAGLWGLPRRWDPQSGALLKSPLSVLGP